MIYFSGKKNNETDNRQSIKSGQREMVNVQDWGGMGETA